MRSERKVDNGPVLRDGLSYKFFFILCVLRQEMRYSET